MTDVQKYIRQHEEGLRYDMRRHLAILPLAPLEEQQEYEQAFMETLFFLLTDSLTFRYDEIDTLEFDEIVEAWNLEHYGRNV